MQMETRQRRMRRTESLVTMMAMNAGPARRRPEYDCAIVIGVRECGDREREAVRGLMMMMMMMKMMMKMMKMCRSP